MISALILAATLAANIEKVEADYTAITNAIAAKGVVPTAGLNNASNDISTIRNDPYWNPPPEYPRIDLMMKADTEDYPYKFFVVYYVSRSDVPIRFDASGGKLLWDGVQVTSPFTTTVGIHVAKVYHTSLLQVQNGNWAIPGSTVIAAEYFLYVEPRWVVANDITITPSRTGWIYYNRKSFEAFDGLTINQSAGAVLQSYAAHPTYRIRKPYRVLLGNLCNDYCSYWSSVYDLSQIITNVAPITNVGGLFVNCASLTSVPSVLDLSQCTSAYNMFGNCYSLESVPSVLDTSNCKRTDGMFLSCHSLKSIPYTINLSQCSNAGNMFRDCISITNCPSTLIANGNNNLAISFSDSTQITKASVEALADGINDLSGSTKPPTVTFASAVRNRFTAEEWAVIVNKFTSKGWNLSPAS